jgi:hypothetical protein
MRSLEIETRAAARCSAALDALEEEKDTPGSAHQSADMLLLEMLRACGHGAVADAYETARRRMGFWYD